MKNQFLRNWIQNKKTSGKEKTRIKTGMGAIASVIVMTLILTGIAQSPVPPESQKILEQLATYEEEVLTAPKAQIQEARAQAVKILGNHLAQTTQQGDLEAALAIQEEIKRLQEQFKLSVQDAEIMGKVGKVEYVEKERQVENTEEVEEIEKKEEPNQETPEGYNGYPIVEGGILITVEEAGRDLMSYPARKIDTDGPLAKVNGLRFYPETRTKEPYYGLYFLNGYITAGIVNQPKKTLSRTGELEDKGSRGFKGTWIQNGKNEIEGRFNQDFTELEFTEPSGKKEKYTLKDPWAEEEKEE